MALINQKSGQRQGQANYVLYPLAAEQYVRYAAPAEPSLTHCAAYLGPQTVSGCYFRDISATPDRGSLITGTTSVPCTGTATMAGIFSDASMDAAANNENCYGYQITVDSSLTVTPDYYGVLSTAEEAASPAFAAGPGYDLATGLGSPNVFSLVNAPQWSGGGLETRVSVALALEQGNRATLLATVMDQGRMPVIGGTVTFFSGDTVLGTVTRECSLRGRFGLRVNGSVLDAARSNVVASFAGGRERCGQRRATYYGSQSESIQGIHPGIDFSPTTAQEPR